MHVSIGIKLVFAVYPQRRLFQTAAGPLYWTGRPYRWGNDSLGCPARGRTMGNRCRRWISCPCLLIRHYEQPGFGLRCRSESTAVRLRAAGTSWSAAVRLWGWPPPSARSPPPRRAVLWWAGWVAGARTPGVWSRCASLAGLLSQFIWLRAALKVFGPSKSRFKVQKIQLIFIR